MSKTKSLIYARVSSREQEESGYSLDSQEKLLRGYSEKCGFELKKSFRVSESASGKQIRKTFNEMLTYATKNNIPVILCEKIDRLTRNLKDAASISDWMSANDEREIHFVKEGFVVNKHTKAHENLVWDMKVAIARFYTNNLSEEVKKGQKEKISQGWLPTKPPLGYKTIGEKGHKIHVIEDKKGSLVKKMFDLYSTGNYSVKKLSEKMYELGLRTNGGNKFGKSRLAATLSDPFYCGKVRWNGEIYDGKQAPLISIDAFNLVQKVLKSKTTPKYSKHLFLFKGNIRCKECGGIITWEVHRGITYGHCNHRYHKCTQEKWSKEYEVEDQIVAIFDMLQIKNSRIFEWVKKVFKESHKDKIEFHSASLQELGQSRQRIEQRLDRLYDEKLDGKIPLDMYEKKFKQYTKEKEDVMHSIQKHTQSDTRYLQLSMDLFELAQRIKEIYISFGKNVEKKRNLLSFVFKDLTLDEGMLSYEFTEAFRLIAQATDFSNCSKIVNSAKSSNKIFEPSKNRLNKESNGSLSTKYTLLLPN